ncbi:MAG: hypothetical protein P4L41_10390 [Flavipsychrobacter sp.]|nr:hypothetical protein [Flavipsychrobacter sp.]
MKRIFLVSASLMIASATFAQSDANADNSLYRFDNAGTPKEVRKLGSAPEFPFLRNMTSSSQVYSAIKKHANDDTRAMHKLNGLLMQLGYENGAADLQPSDISMSYVQPGTEGNMGSRGYVYSYTRVEGNRSEFKAWKIAPKSTGTTNGSLYLFAKCGNAFFPKNNATACLTVPVTVTADMQQITLNSSGTKVTTNDEVFVYYSRRHHRRHEQAFPVADISDKYPSTPLMVSDTKDVNVMPETYNVTLSTPNNTVSACPETTLNVAANVNVEKTSAYTGNYPNSDHKTYKKVSKHEYKMIARRMRRIHRKEDRIAHKTGMAVDVRTDKV